MSDASAPAGAAASYRPLVLDADTYREFAEHVNARPVERLDAVPGFYDPTRPAMFATLDEFKRAFVYVDEVLAMPVLRSMDCVSRIDEFAFTYHSRNPMQRFAAWSTVLSDFAARPHAMYDRLVEAAVNFARTCHLCEARQACMRVSIQALLDVWAHVRVIFARATTCEMGVATSLTTCQLAETCNMGVAQKNYAFARIWTRVCASVRVRFGCICSKGKCVGRRTFEDEYGSPALYVTPDEKQDYVRARELVALEQAAARARHALDARAAARSARLGTPIPPRKPSAPERALALQTGQDLVQRAPASVAEPVVVLKAARITDLPFELLCYIMHFAAETFVDVARIRTVCRAFNHAVCDDSVLVPLARIFAAPAPFPAAPEPSACRTIDDWVLRVAALREIKLLEHLQPSRTSSRNFKAVLSHIRAAGDATLAQRVCRASQHSGVHGELAWRTRTLMQLSCETINALCAGCKRWLSHRTVAMLHMALAYFYTPGSYVGAVHNTYILSLLNQCLLAEPHSANSLDALCFWIQHVDINRSGLVAAHTAGMFEIGRRLLAGQTLLLLFDMPRPDASDDVAIKAAVARAHEALDAMYVEFDARIHDELAAAGHSQVRIMHHVTLENTRRAVALSFTRVPRTADELVAGIMRAAAAIAQRPPSRFPPAVLEPLHIPRDSSIAEIYCERIRAMRWRLEWRATAHDGPQWQVGAHTADPAVAGWTERMCAYITSLETTWAGRAQLAYAHAHMDETYPFWAVDLANITLAGSHLRRAIRDALCGPPPHGPDVPPIE